MVVPVTQPVIAAGEANGAPSDIQTVEAKLGKETHSPHGGAVVDEMPSEVEGFCLAAVRSKAVWFETATEPANSGMLAGRRQRPWAKYTTAV